MSKKQLVDVEIVNLYLPWRGKELPPPPHLREPDYSIHLERKIPNNCIGCRRLQVSVRGAKPRCTTFRTLRPGCLTRLLDQAHPMPLEEE